MSELPELKQKRLYDSHNEVLKRARAEKDRLINEKPKPIKEVIPAPIPEKRKVKKPKPVEPEPEPIPVYVPPDPVLEIIDAGLLEEIPLTPEEKKAIKIQQLQAKIAILEKED
ncbi:MAG: hypothetical protein MUO31_00960 [Thermodesulfovibrionales bacterium]|nr:hypothetical protein [Thermodesulfovibrionales bacterium]